MKVQLCLLVLVPAIFASVIPKADVISRCKDASQADMGACIMKIFNDMIPDFAEGLPEFSLPSMSEVPIENYGVSDYQSENSYFNIDMADITSKGMEESKLVKLDIDYDNKVATWETNVPEIFVRAKYKMTAKLTFIPIEGEGTMWGKMGNVAVKGHHKFDFVGDDKHLMTVGTVDDLDSETLTVRFNNLFPGNEILKEAAEAFINGNTKDIADLIEPELNKKLSILVTNTVNNIGATLPLKDIAGEQYIRKAFNL